MDCSLHFHLQASLSCWDAGKALELTCSPLEQQSLGLLIFHLIDPSWPKGGQEVLCILECTEAWEQNVL